MHRGYIALWRKIKDHPFATEPREFSKYEAWIDLLMEAQHDRNPQRVIIGMNVIECHYGECLKSVTTWADRWKWSRSKVFRFLKLLKKMDQINYTSETVTTRIKIINYESYDPRRNGKKTEEERGRNDSETQAVTDKNDKNVKNINNTTPDPKKKKFSLTKYDYPEWVNKDLFLEWAAMRVKIKKPIASDGTVTRAINALKKIMDQGHRQDDVIELAIDRNWQSFYPPKNGIPDEPTCPGPREITLENCDELSR